MRRLIIQYKNFILKVNISNTNTCIIESYKVKSIDDMLGILEEISHKSDYDSAINNRSLWGMVHEWRAHNLLYSLGIQKDRTESVDLNIGQPWYIKVIYSILSMFYLHF